MKRRSRLRSLIALASAAVVCVDGAVLAGQPAAEPADHVAAARKAAGALGASLVERLTAAVKDGGPIAGLNVCNTVAQEITAKSAEAAGFRVARTALKLRNPGNVPDAWERSVLERFQDQLSKGADPATLEHHETVSEAGRPTLRYMKAIPTGEACLACHGGSVKPEIAAEIRRLYPDDKATGFELGSLRGAFTISKPLP